MDTDTYNINKYTDKELYKILEMSESVTDRELESKILFYIDKYKNIRSKDDRLIHAFFIDVYDRFFESTDVSTKEGFIDTPNTDTLTNITSILSSSSFGLAIPSNLQSIIGDFATYIYKLGQQSALTIAEPFTAPTQSLENADKPDNNDKQPSDPSYVANLSYTPGKLNPILKETIKRIISIDSQYRDIAVYPNGSTFSFNLSDTLIDVVSLKLYSIQIPYTWYTINGNFGANFFYINGISPGVEGDSFQIIIPSGNYTQASIISAVSSSIQTLKTNQQYADISFGITDISYNASTVKSTITIDINKNYDETYYQLDFITATSPQDSSYNTQSISSMMGFNHRTYNYSSVYSKTFATDVSSNSYLDVSANPYYLVPDISNSNIDAQLEQTYTFTTCPSFNIFLYMPPAASVPDYTKLTMSDISSSLVNMSVLETLPTRIYDPSSADISANCINIALSRLAINTPYLGGDIADEINYQLRTNKYLNDTSNASIQLLQSYITNEYVNGIITPPQTRSLNQRFRMNIRLNRQWANLNNANIKVAVQFPQETNADPSNNPIFSGEHSLFEFPSPITDMSFITLNNIVSESPVLSPNIIQNYPYILAHCNKPGYETRLIDYIYTFPAITDASFGDNWYYDDYKNALMDVSAHYYEFDDSSSNQLHSAISTKPKDVVQISFNEQLSNGKYENKQIIDVSFNINRNFYNEDYTVNLSNTSLSINFGFLNDISFNDYRSFIYSYCPSGNIYPQYVPTSTQPFYISNLGLSYTPYINLYSSTDITSSYPTQISFDASYGFTSFTDASFGLLSYMNSHINSYLSNPTTNKVHLDYSYNLIEFTDTSYNYINDPTKSDMYRFSISYTLADYRIDLLGCPLFTIYNFVSNSKIVLNTTVKNTDYNVSTITLEPSDKILVGNTHNVYTFRSIDPRNPDTSGNFAYDISYLDISANYLDIINDTYNNFNASSPDLSNNTNYNINNAGLIDLSYTHIVAFDLSHNQNTYNQFDISFNIQTAIQTSDYTVQFLSSSSPALTSGNSTTPAITHDGSIAWDSSQNSWYQNMYMASDISSVELLSSTVPCFLHDNTIYVDDTNRYFTIQGIYPNINTGTPTTDIIYDLLSNTNSAIIPYPDINSLVARINAVIQTQNQSDASINNVFCSGSFELFQRSPPTNGRYHQYTRFQISLNKKYTASDYSLVFYDPFSFTYCNTGIKASSAQNITWDSTLGWILGYRGLIQYFLTPANMGTANPGLYPATFYVDITTDTNYTTTPYYSDPVTKIVTITGDTSVSVNLYSYFMILLDDYCQNHLNDGLVTIISSASDIPLPSYANRATMLCSPSGENIVNPNGLTQNQIYSATQIHNQQQSKIKSYSTGPFVHDVFALVPIKTAGLTYGNTYIEFGGALQLQERVYFGPVNIRKLTITLIDDHGTVVDLNNANWSFSLICEQLYNPSPQK